jgi:hypothetical protein
MTLLTSAYTRKLTHPVLDVFLLAAREARSAEVFEEAVARVIAAEEAMPSPARLLREIGQLQAQTALILRRDKVEIPRPSTRTLVEQHCKVNDLDRAWWSKIVRELRLPGWFRLGRAIFLPPDNEDGRPPCVLVDHQGALAWWMSPVQREVQRAIGQRLVLRYGGRWPWLAVVVRPDLATDEPWDGEGGDYVIVAP